MTQTVIRGPVVEAPTPTPHTGDLLDVADVHEGLAWLQPADMFTSWNCLDADSVEVCGPDADPGQDLRGTRPGRRGAVRGLPGWRLQAALDGRRRQRQPGLRPAREPGRGEGVRGPHPRPGAPPCRGTPVTTAHALAMMENALADAYAGVGTIHMSPLLATLYLGEQLLVEVGGKFYTKLGTKVVVGTGYTSTNLYGSGDVTVYRSAKTLAPGPDTANNVINVLAERAYIVVADCVSLKMVGIPMPTGGV